jgi:hypothetical protein
METKLDQLLRLLPHRQLREFEGNSAASDPAVPVRILREVLLVVVGAEAFSCTEFARLSDRGQSTGRLLVDVDVDPVADHDAPGRRNVAVRPTRVNRNRLLLRRSLQPYNPGAILSASPRAIRQSESSQYRRWQSRLGAPSSPTT